VKTLMKTRKNDSLPFRMKTKKVLERKVAGPNVLVMSLADQDDVKIKPEEHSDKVDGRVLSQITDNDFVLEGWISNSAFYTCDVLFYEGEDLREEPWNERYKVLKNGFDWNYTARLSKPIVVAADGNFDAEEEVKDAAMIFKQLENSEGMLVRDYDESYGQTREFIPNEEIGEY